MQLVKEIKSGGTMIGVNVAKRRLSDETRDKLVLANQGYSVKRRRTNLFGHSINGNSEVSNDFNFHTDAFAKMQNLRLLQLSYVQLTGYYEKFPKRLRWMYWRGFSSKSIPDDFPLESLVALDMRNSSLEQVWRGRKFLGLLKILNFSHSYGLRITPDFSGLPNLKILILKYCIRLVDVHESIGELERPVLLNLRGCKNLRKLPGEIGRLKSLEKFIISGCSKLKLPVELSKLESLTELHADDIALNELASASDEVKSWPALIFSWASKQKKSQQSISFSLSSLSRSLSSLSLANCNLSDDSISIDLCRLSLLRYLNLSGNPICSLPESIKNHPMLRDLWLDSCTRLQSLPELPLNLIDLKTVGCTSLAKITNLPNLLKSLFLDVSGCEKLAEVQGLFILEPVGNFDAEMIMSLGFLNLEIIGNNQVDLFNKMTDTIITVPVQGLYEFGIFSTCIPGSEVPSQFCVKGKNNSVSFTVSLHPNTKIRGLNICIVYARSSEKRYRYWSNQKLYAYYIKVSNKTNGQKWVYFPTFIGIPRAKEDMTFLGHWKFENQLEVGDEVSVSVIVWSTYTFKMKEFGVSLVYDKLEEKVVESNVEEEKGKQAIQGTSICSSHQGVSECNASGYQFKKNEYFLSHPDYFALRRKSRDEGIRMILYEHLFAEPTKTIEFTHEEEGEEIEEDSDYDYPDTDDSDFNEEVKAEVEELLAAPNWWD